MRFALLTMKEAAEFAKISQRHLDHQIKSGRGPAVTQIGSSVRLRSDVFQEWLESRTESSSKVAA